MLYKNSFLLWCVLTTVSNTLCSLKSLTAHTIIGDDRLAAGLGQLAPAVQQVVGFQYLKENLPFTWKEHAEPCKLFERTVDGVGFLGDSARLVAVDTKGILHQWDTRHGQTADPCDTMQGRVKGFCISHDGAFVATGGATSIKIWDAYDFKELREFHCDEPICSLAFNKTATQLVAGGAQGRVFIFDISSGKCKTFVHATFQEHVALNEVFAVGFSADDQRVYSGCRFPSKPCIKTIKIWTMGGAFNEIILANPSRLGSMIFTHDDHAFTSFTDGLFVDTDLLHATSVDSTLGANDETGLEASVMSSDGRFLLTGSMGPKSCLWERGNNGSYSLVREFDGGGFARHVAFRRDGEELVIGTLSGLIRMSITSMHWKTLKEAQGPQYKRSKVSGEGSASGDQQGPQDDQRRQVLPLAELLAAVNGRIAAVN